MTAVRATHQVCYFDSGSWTVNKDQCGPCANSAALTWSVRSEPARAMRPADLCCYLQPRVARVTLINTVLQI